MRSLELLLLLVLFTLVEGWTVDTSMRFPRQIHVREDDWKEFARFNNPKLKRWEKENNTIEHDPVNMEEKAIRVSDAIDGKDFTVSRAPRISNTN